LPLQSSNFKIPSNLGEITPATQAKSLNLLHCATGSPSSKYEHWHRCVTFEILGFVWEKKTIVSVTNENELISIKKKQLTLHKMCVTFFLCGPWAD